MNQQNPAPAPASPRGVGLVIDLPARAFVRHESVPFTVALTNHAAGPIHEVLAPRPENAAVHVTASSPSGSRTADQLSGRVRDGLRTHPPMQPVKVELSPGQTLECQGDLLEWFGGLTPERYALTPSYDQVLVLNPPQPAALTIQPARPEGIATPRCAARLPGVSLPAAWVHNEGNRRILFYQLQSDALPSNPRLGVRVAEGPEISSVEVSTITMRECRSGHIFWTGSAGSRFYSPVAFEPSAARPEARPLKLPAGAQLLRSPLSVPDGSVWIPVADSSRVGILRVTAAGAASTYGPIETGELGAYCCYWDYDANLLFAYSPKSSGQFHYSTLSLSQPERGVTRSFDYEFNSPVVWIDGYSDTESPSDRAEPVFWIVHEQDGNLVCSRFFTESKRWSAATMLPASRFGSARIFSSVVTRERQLAFLFSNADGQIFYGSTGGGSISPLGDILSHRVRLSDNPALLSASDSGVFPWVHVRYAAADRFLVAVAKIEPSDERDAMDDR